MTGQVTTRITVRHETRPTERRAPISPRDAAALVGQGITLTVERSPQRVFADEDYAAAGCVLAPAGSWRDAPADEFVIGLKELPGEPEALRHRHIYFGHAYKGQRHARALLRRFAEGGGALLDLEYLVDARGRRVAAFGYWAGYAGAALAVLRSRGHLTAPLKPGTKDELDRALRRDGEPLRALVIGALGRCGRGACDALAASGTEPTRWDIEETRTLDVPAILEHDLLVNAVLATGPATPFLTGETLRRPRRLSVISDVTCDVGSPFHTLPIYDEVTTWTEPVRGLGDTGAPLDLIAIDNLPSLLPREASLDFSAQLAPHLRSLEGMSPVWRNCLDTFRETSANFGLLQEDNHA
ncbi:saccharopine dehydrogenase [Amycolatopsis rhizosphaerae]|uniref:Saccharopine dehydrogenase [NAD(+), L-lysine-forming] n=1 Tax=Amycolatopsis rhizosphaerae TaxID=2053003 RepID=A0A558B5V5_9PSEU|nr:saccharopine dehydrogenase [Amycolatopsis rhizosphaerae]TVT31890.1 saccharopine dehydrogenase [Amycolatopsis rhizosphaerae]